MLIQTISNVTQFRDAFARCGRENQFSYDALGLLFDYFDNADESIELSPVTFCCEYCEMTPEEVVDAYSLSYDNSTEDADDVLEFLDRHTLVVGQTKSGTFVFAEF